MEGANVTSCLFPTQPSGSEGQTDDIHKERERLRLVLKQMGRIKCPSEVCITSFSRSLSLSHSFPPLCSVMSFRLIFPAFKVLFPFSSCANSGFVSPFTYLSLSFPEGCSRQLGQNQMDIPHYSQCSAKTERT